MTQDASNPTPSDAEIKAYLASTLETADAQPRTVEHVSLNPVTGEVTPIDPPVQDHLADAQAEVDRITAEAETFAAGEPRVIVPADKHEVASVVPPPTTLEAARALPEAAPTETLFEVVEHHAVKAFLDVENEVKHVFMNALGYFVKAVRHG